MTKSFMEYHDSGFWTSDSFAELWLYLLCEEIDDLTMRPHWIVVARRDWRTQATVGFVGKVSCCFDAHLGERRDRVETIERLASQVRKRIQAYGDTVPCEVLNRFGTGGKKNRFTADLDTAQLLLVCDAFTALLRGEHPRASPESPTIPR